MYVAAISINAPFADGCLVSIGGVHRPRLHHHIQHGRISYSVRTTTVDQDLQRREIGSG